MMKLVTALMLSFVCVCGAAGAWTVDPNLASSTEYHPFGVPCAIASNTATGKLVVIYWSHDAVGDHVVYSEKNSGTGVWNQEAIADFEDSATVDYERGNVAVDLTPDDRPIIVYSYRRTTLSDGVASSVECVNKICEKATVGIQNDRVLVSQVFSPTMNVDAFESGLLVGDSDNMIVLSVLMYSVGPEQVHQYVLVEVLGDSASGFPRKNLLYERDSTMSYGAVGMITGGGFAWDSTYKARLLLGLFNAAGVSDLNYYGFLTDTQVTERDFPLNLFCPPVTTTNTSFGLIGAITTAYDGSLVAAPDATGCLHVVYEEGGSGLLRYASEAEPLSLLWLSSSVNADSGRPAVGFEAESIDYQYVPLMMTCKPVPRVVMAERNTATDQTSVRVAVKSATSPQWSWGNRLEVPCVEHLVAVSNNCTAIAYSNSGNQIQVALP